MLNKDNLCLINRFNVCCFTTFQLDVLFQATECKCWCKLTAFSRFEAANMHIILVEDDNVCSEIMGAALARGGMQVTSVADGAGAIALLDNGVCPDLLLTDIRLPGDWDGWLIARMYQDEWPGLPVIYISATQPSTDQVDNSVYLRKPVCPKLLLQAVRALARARVRAGRRLH
jgi:CheY-like chemotaxis protein